jgi:hypothetical protein
MDFWKTDWFVGLSVWKSAMVIEIGFFLFRDRLIGLAFVRLDFEYGCGLVWTSYKLWTSYKWFLLC